MKSEIIKFTPLNAEDQREQCRLLIKLQEEQLGYWTPLKNASDLSIRMSKTFGGEEPLRPTVGDLTEIINKLEELKRLQGDK